MKVVLLLISLGFLSAVAFTAFKFFFIFKDQVNQLGTLTSGSWTVNLVQKTPTGGEIKNLIEINSSAGEKVLLQLRDRAQPIPARILKSEYTPLGDIDPVHLRGSKQIVVSDALNWPDELKCFQIDWVEGNRNIREEIEGLLKEKLADILRLFNQTRSNGKAAFDKNVILISKDFIEKKEIYKKDDDESTIITVNNGYWVTVSNIESPNMLATLGHVYADQNGAHFIFERDSVPEDIRPILEQLQSFKDQNGNAFTVNYQNPK